MPDQAPKWTRYLRVKEILNQASGNTNPSYQGYGRFWELPLPEFLEVVIYGVRMIAPVRGTPAPAGAAPAKPSALPMMPGGSCCHGPAPAAPAAPPPKPGRGAASGLIIGLRGQCPFDGTQFPRLPWDGSPVSDSDIQFIQDWIDAGCPADDAPPASAGESSVMARARGDEEHPRSAAPVNQYHDDSGTPKARMNINALSPEELSRYRAAIAKMKSYDSFYQDERSFGYWARVHANQCQHGWEEFLTWHRVYLYHFEQQLQDIDPTVTVPYWDWTDNYQADVPASIFDTTQSDPSAKTDNGIVPAAFRCWIDQAGLDRLKAGGKVPADVLGALDGVLNQQFNSGLRLFLGAKIDYGKNPVSDRAILDELGVINPLWHRLRWPGGDQNLIFEAYPTPEDVQRILQLTNFFSFGSGPMNNHFFGALENIHNLIHNFSGGANPNYQMGHNPWDRDGEPQSGDMVQAGVTAYDPIFWGHHSNVDRLWAEWQSLHPGVEPDDPSAVLPPWSLSVGDTFNIADFGYEYLKSAHLYQTNNQVPMARFKSAMTPAAPQVLADHSSAEVRLHKVKYRTRAGFHIRVFLNSPDAGVSTPTRGNPRYVGMLNTFTGFCVGGPGHCDPPPETRRKFDRRHRPHKTPGNYRLDATAAVAALMQQGETAFQVNLVALNTDGSPATDALLLDAVSLVFKE